MLLWRKSLLPLSARIPHRIPRGLRASQHDRADNKEDDPGEDQKSEDGQQSMEQHEGQPDAKRKDQGKQYRYDVREEPYPTSSIGWISIPHVVALFLLSRAIYCTLVLISFSKTLFAIKTPFYRSDAIEYFKATSRKHLPL